ncbi:MAG: acetyl-coenzyme A synthetase N-terminal domain-containing protein, partial [Candidatus Nitrotoga sp.]
MTTNITSIAHEVHIFQPPAPFAQQANVSGMVAYQNLCAAAAQDYTGFWAQLARENIVWKRPFTITLNESNPPFYQWFEDGQLNISYNCLDKHLAT